MVITFPHMGGVYLLVKALFEDLGINVVVPPAISKKTLELGTRHSPESACLPFKINIGNYIESIEKGADTILMVGGCGPCRFGYYGVLQEEILKDLGYCIDMIIIDSPVLDFAGFIDNIKKVTRGKPLLRTAKDLMKLSKALYKLDELYDISLKKRAREKKIGDTDKILMHFEKEALACHGINRLSALIYKYKTTLKNIEERNNAKPIKIGLVGEIYALIEPYVNLNIEQKLGQLGVEVHRSITLTEFIKLNLPLSMKFKWERKNKLNKAARYLDVFVGGHGQDSVANTVGYSEAGLDGVIQVLPFGCMPEIVARSIIPTIASELKFPTMIMSIDELTGEAGYMTRLEAFVDLILQRKYTSHSSIGRDLSSKTK